MNKSSVKKRLLKHRFVGSNKKKHVESMFLTNKTKHHPYYFKNRSLFNTSEVNPSNLTPPFMSASVRTLQSGYFTLKPLKSIARFFKWFSKNYFTGSNIKLCFRIFPDFVLTSKPKEVRLAKGKGANLIKVAPVKAGQILFSINIDRREDPTLLRSLMQKLSFKIPLKHQIIFNAW